MQVGVLGPLLVHRDDQVVNVAGTRLRALLIRLAVEPGRRVSVTELVDAVWPDDPPEDPGNALQSLVSRLRRVLGDPALVQPRSLPGTSYDAARPRPPSASSPTP